VTPKLNHSFKKKNFWGGKGKRLVGNFKEKEQKSCKLQATSCKFFSATTSIH